MINHTKWIVRLSAIGRTVYRLIKQLDKSPTRIVCDMPDGRWCVILSPNDSEYHIYITDKEEFEHD